jgi:integrase
VSFFVMRRLPGKPQPVRVVLGRYPDISLAKARQLAGEALGDLVAGVHPKERERRLAADQRQSHTFAALVERYLARRASGRRTAREIARIVGRYLLPRFGSRSVTDIRRGDVVAMIEDIADRNGRHAARQAHTYVAAILGYGCTLEFGGLQANAARYIRVADLVGEAKARQRVLTDSELARVWEAAQGYPAGAFFRMAILTGARRSEIAEMTWDEINLDAGLWTLAGARTKNGKPDEKPLSGMAVSLLRSLPRFTGYVFTSSAGRRPMQGFDKFKREIDKRVPGLGNWRIHDLRRTMRTGLATIGVSPFVAELCIGHQQKGVHAVYDVHRYRAEKADAMERWANKLRSIIEPPPQNVVSLRQ